MSKWAHLDVFHSHFNHTSVPSAFAIIRRRNGAKHTKAKLRSINRKTEAYSAKENIKYTVYKSQSEQQIAQIPRIFRQSFLK